jgi:uroporphyrinogen-III synthase
MAPSPTNLPLRGQRVIVFEARHGAELERLLARHGASVVRAPALREERLDETPAALEFARRLARNEIGLVILLTGVGTRALATAVAATYPEFTTQLGRTTIVARGPKPLAALRELGVSGARAVASPFTWRQVLDTVDGLGLARGTAVAVQEYGSHHAPLCDALTSRGFEVIPVPVYRWALPDDPAPLQAAAAQLARGDADVAVFTSAVQAHHLMQVATDTSALRAGMRHVVVASIGPACTEALTEHGLAPDLEADPPKLGPLVALLAERATAVLAKKRT